MIRHRLPQAWLDWQPRQPGHAALRRKLERAAGLLTRAGPGYGAERCLYELNPDWPCRSPLLKGLQVLDAGRLLTALEQIAAGRAGGREPIDAHIAGFCAARLAKVTDYHLKRLAESEDESKRRLGMLDLLAEIQRLRGPDSLPGLAGWLAQLLTPSLDTLHNKPNRRGILERLQDTVARGSLEELLALLGDDSRWQDDGRGFASAEDRFRRMDWDIDWLQSGGLTAPARIRQKSGLAAVLTSAVLAGLVTLGFTLHFVVS